MAAYAAGTLDAASEVLVRAQLALRPEGRVHIEALETLGGVLLDQIEPMPLTAPETMAAGIVASAAGPEPVAFDGGSAAGQAALRDEVVPPLLRSFIGRDLDSLEWSRVTSGVREAVIVDDARCLARVMIVLPGYDIPRQTPEGFEAVLVLKGQLRDEFGDYGRGETCVSDETLTHDPRAIGTDDCLFFAVCQKPSSDMSALPVQPADARSQPLHSKRRGPGPTIPTQAPTGSILSS